MNSLYLDASAIAKLVIEEPETAAIRGFVEGRSLMSNRVAVVEVTKAVARADPGAVLEPFFGTISFVELDAELALIAGTTGNAGLRALDAVHVASALRLGPEVEVFVTYDGRQAAAAAAVGLRVESPGIVGTLSQ